MSTSIVIPAKNEEFSLKSLIPELKAELPQCEIIVVNDGSTDLSESICKQLGVTVVKHEYSIGNGAAIKSGARASKSEHILFMDADGQHTVQDAKNLIQRMNNSPKDMIIGQRNRLGQASLFRLIANSFYNWFSSKMTGYKISDLTSGLRIVNRKKFLKILYLLPNGFSYPTTSTMAFLRSGYSVDFLPINVQKRIGKSHINIIKDGFRFFLIIIKIGTLYSPLKIFLPLSLSFFTLGISYYVYTLIEFGRFTNMSALLITTSIITFLIGLVSEQITNLMYKDSE